MGVSNSKSAVKNHPVRTTTTEAILEDIQKINKNDADGEFKELYKSTQAALEAGSTCPSDVLMRNLVAMLEYSNQQLVECFNEIENCQRDLVELVSTRQGNKILNNTNTNENVHINLTENQNSITNINDIQINVDTSNLIQEINDQDQNNEIVVTIKDNDRDITSNSETNKTSKNRLNAHLPFDDIELN